MKKYIVIWVFIAVCCISVADSIDEFVASLNQAWSQTNDVQTLQIINARLATNTNDILALSCKMYYYVFAEGNLTNARSAADQFMARVNSQTTNVYIIAYAQEMRDEIQGIPLEELGPYTGQQQAQLRSLNLSFPFIQKCVTLTRGVEE